MYKPWMSNPKQLPKPTSATTAIINSRRFDTPVVDISFRVVLMVLSTPVSQQWSARPFEQHTVHDEKV